MYVLTDGKHYVMENPMKIGEYLQTTSPLQATDFTYKQARNLVKKSKNKYAWIKNFQLVNLETGEKSENSLNYNGNNAVYINDNIQFDEGLLDKIIKESSSIIGLAGWDIQQINTYKNILNRQLSMCDSAESDIKHALEKYKVDHDGKKPQAHKIAKLGYVLDELRDKHKKIKLCLRYIQVMEDAITYHYTIGKIKLELSKAECREYKGRTEYWNIALDILGE